MTRMTLTKELGTHLLNPLVGYIQSGKVEQKRRSRRRARLQNWTPVPSGPRALPTSLKPTVVLVASAFVVTFSFGSWSPFHIGRNNYFAQAATNIQFQVRYLGLAKPI